MAKCADPDSFRKRREEEEEKQTSAKQSKKARRHSILRYPLAQIHIWGAADPNSRFDIRDYATA